MKQKHDITICLGSSCFSRGNKEILPIVKGYLKEHDLESDIFFHGDLCSGQCEYGPVLKIDDQVFKKVSIDNIYEILNEVFN